MGQRFWISSIVAAVLFCLLGFVVHETLLHNDYAQISSLFRTPEDALRRMPNHVRRLPIDGLCIHLDLPAGHYSQCFVVAAGH